MTVPSISVVLPVYNEEGCIEPVLRELLAVLDGVAEPWEVIAVDDGSRDQTPVILRRLRAEFPRLRVLTLVRNGGQSAAFGAGFRAARGEWLVTLDADGQNDPADLPALLARRDGADAICGFRARRRDTWSKRLGSRLANAVRNSVLSEEVVDTGCALKVFRRGLVADLPVWNGMHRFFPTWFAMKGAVIRQLPVNHRPRVHSQERHDDRGLDQYPRARLPEFPLQQRRHPRIRAQLSLRQQRMVSWITTNIGRPADFV